LQLISDLSKYSSSICSWNCRLCCDASIQSSDWGHSIQTPSVNFSHNV
jgi:hypothetical protein